MWQFQNGLVFEKRPKIGQDIAFWSFRKINALEVNLDFCPRSNVTCSFLTSQITLFCSIDRRLTCWLIWWWQIWRGRSKKEDAICCRFYKLSAIFLGYKCMKIKYKWTEEDEYMFISLRWYFLVWEECVSWRYNPFCCHLNKMTYMFLRNVVGYHQYVRWFY